MCRMQKLTGSILRGAVVVFLSAMAAFPLYAAEISVNTVEGLYEAVRDAANGDVVTVATGTYQMTAALGTLVIDKGITVQSAGSWRDTFFEPADGVTDTCLVKVAHANAVFKGFTLRNMTATANMGPMAIFIDDPSGGMVSDCRVTGCGGTGTRYVVRMSLGSKITRCRIDGNSATSVFWAQSGSLGNASGTQMSICNCLVYGNSATVFILPNLANLKPVIDHCTIVDNYSGSYIASPQRESTFKNSVLLPASTCPCAFNRPFSGYTLGSRNGTSISNCFYPGPNPDFQKCTYSSNVTGDPYASFVNATASDYRPSAGSPLIGAAGSSSIAEGVDIDGRTRPVNAPTIGCFEFDPAAEDAGPHVRVPAGGDIAAAVASAADGTVIHLAEGEYSLAGTVTVGKPLWIVGAGQGKTIVRGGIGFDMFKLGHFRARVSDLTIADATESRGLNMSAGWVDACRITGISWKTTNGAVQGLAAYLSGGCVSRCLFDSNVYRRNNSSSSVLCLSSNTPTGYVNCGIARDCLVVDNEIGATSANLYGAAVYLTRSGAGTGGCVLNSSVFGNRTSYAVSASEYVGKVGNCIIADSSLGQSKSWNQGGGSSLNTDAKWLARTGTASTVWCNNCSAVPIGSACVAEPPLVKKTGRISSASPCIAAAEADKWSLQSLDFAGKPRLARDGTQDIGCCQHNPPGLSILLR